MSPAAFVWPHNGVGRARPQLRSNVGVRKTVQNACLVWHSTGDANHVLKDAGPLVLGR